MRRLSIPCVLLMIIKLMEEVTVKRNSPIPKALTVAGSDSGGGAGIQADLKTFQEFQVYGMSVLTAVTAQNTLGVHGVYDLPVEAVEAQLRAVLDDIGADAVKTGMLAHEQIILRLAELFSDYQVRNLVVDPVMVAKGGAPLLREEALEALRKKLIPLARLVTPNIPEACRLTGMSEISTVEQMERAARLIGEMGAQAVLVKGGHRDSVEAVDVLVDDRKTVVFRLPRIASPHTHGTGCTLSAAIAAGLACGHDLEEAVWKAKRFVHEAIRGGIAGLGKGIGPLDHATYRRGASGFPAAREEI